MPAGCRGASEPLPDFVARPALWWPSSRRRFWVSRLYITSAAGSRATIRTLCALSRENTVAKFATPTIRRARSAKPAVRILGDDMLCGRKKENLRRQVSSGCRAAGGAARAGPLDHKPRAIRSAHPRTSAVSDVGNRLTAALESDRAWISAPSARQPAGRSAKARSGLDVRQSQCSRTGAFALFDHRGIEPRGGAGRDLAHCHARIGDSRPTHLARSLIESVLRRFASAPPGLRCQLIETALCALCIVQCRREIAFLGDPLEIQLNHLRLDRPTLATLRKGRPRGRKQRAPHQRADCRNAAGQPGMRLRAASVGPHGHDDLMRQRERR